MILVILLEEINLQLRAKVDVRLEYLLSLKIEARALLQHRKHP